MKRKYFENKILENTLDRVQLCKCAAVKKNGKTSAERQNRSALAKSAAYLQSFMLFLAETEIE